MAKIYIDPSTQIGNAYAGGGNERDEMRKVRDHLVPMLQAAGHETRTGNWTNELTSPVAAANAWGADLYLALHSNATGSAKARARGVSAHVFGLGGKAEKLARLLLEEAAKLSPVPTRGVIASNFYVLRKTKMPAVLTENDFHDNPGGAAWIKANHRTIAIWHARAVCRLVGGLDKLEAHLNGASPAPAPSPAPTPAAKYAVTAAGLNVRKGPGTKHGTFGSPLPRGAIWYGTGRKSGAWVEGRSPWMRANKIAAHWVHGSYLKGV